MYYITSPKLASSAANSARLNPTSAVRVSVGAWGASLGLIMGSYTLKPPFVTNAKAIKPDAILTRGWVQKRPKSLAGIASCLYSGPNDKTNSPHRRVCSVPAPGRVMSMPFAPCRTKGPPSSACGARHHRSAHTFDGGADRRQSQGLASPSLASADGL